jgi:hypothetical protein
MLDRTSKLIYLVNDYNEERFIINMLESRKDIKHININLAYPKHYISKGYDVAHYDNRANFLGKDPYKILNRGSK